jgi:hypothetical protein
VLVAAAKKKEQLDAVSGAEASAVGNMHAPSTSCSKTRAFSIPNVSLAPWLGLN